MTFRFDFAHPYSRYGLATALLQARRTESDLTTENAPEILSQAIETGLNNFRLMTSDEPTTADILRFRPLPFLELQRDTKLVQSAGLAAQGKYLAPSAITTDGDAKGTYDNATAIIENLRAGKDLESDFTFSRSFAPTTAKINNGRSSQSPPKGSLFEAACNVIATLTPVKPAAWVTSQAKEDKYNTAIVPDLSLNALGDFIELFQSMMISQLDGNLYIAKLTKTPTVEGKKQKAKRKKNEGEESAKPKSEYKRPRIFNGNYPFAPRQPALGPAGLLAAIGRWGLAANETEWAQRVLESIAGTPEKSGVPLYIISYDNIAQVQFTHHVVGLSVAGKLSEIIDALIFETQILSEIEKGRRFDAPAYKLFYLMASRFLHRFEVVAFRDFLTTRAEYAPAIKPLFEVYFMQARRISKDIVESARELGQWLNRTAFFVADTEIKPDAPERRAKVQKEKAKILVEFESAAMSAKTPQDMLHRISTRAGRLLQQDAPAAATRFMDATNSGEIEPQDALHLLIAYLRLRSEKTDKVEAPPVAGARSDNPNAAAAFDPLA